MEETDDWLEVSEVRPPSFRDAAGWERVATVARYCGYRVPGPLLVRVPSSSPVSGPSDGDAYEESSYAAVRVTFRSGSSVPAQGFRARYRFGRLVSASPSPTPSVRPSSPSDILNIFGASPNIRIALFSAISFPVVLSNAHFTTSHRSL